MDIKQSSTKEGITVRRPIYMRLVGAIEVLLEWGHFVSLHRTLCGLPICTVSFEDVCQDSTELLLSWLACKCVFLTGNCFTLHSLFRLLVRMVGNGCFQFTSTNWNKPFCLFRWGITVSSVLLLELSNLMTIYNDSIPTSRIMILIQWVEVSVPLASQSVFLSLFPAPIEHF